MKISPSYYEYFRINLSHIASISSQTFISSPPPSVRTIRKTFVPSLIKIKFSLRYGAHLLKNCKSEFFKFLLAHRNSKRLTLYIFPPGVFPSVPSVHGVPRASPTPWRHVSRLIVPSPCVSPPLHSSATTLQRPLFKVFVRRLSAVSRGASVVERVSPSRAFRAVVGSSNPFPSHPYPSNKEIFDNVGKFRTRRKTLFHFPPRCCNRWFSRVFFVYFYGYNRRNYVQQVTDYKYFHRYLLMYILTPREFPVSSLNISVNCDGLCQVSTKKTLFIRGIFDEGIRLVWLEEEGFIYSIGYWIGSMRI